METTDRNSLINSINKITKGVGEMISLSLACGNYTSIWYDNSDNTSYVKWVSVTSWDVDTVEPINSVPTNSLTKILDDLKTDFEELL